MCWTKTCWKYQACSGFPNNTIAAINDEEGKVFLVDPEDGDIQVRKFGKKRDYEDVVLLDTFYFVLESNGNIHRVPVNVKHVDDEFEFHRKKKIEFESLYLDPGNKLILLSKEQRESKKGVLAYSFDPSYLDVFRYPGVRHQMERYPEYSQEQQCGIQTIGSGYPSGETHFVHCGQCW